MNRDTADSRFSILRVIQLLLIVPVLPLYLIARLFTSFEAKPFTAGRAARFLASFILSVFVVLPAYITVYGLAGYFAWQRLGYTEHAIALSGTGSMYPTFPKGHGKDPKELSREVVGTPGMFPYPNGLVVMGKRYFNHTIARGDIVVAENDVIRDIGKKLFGEPSGVVKRVIAVGGDTIELRDGIVYLNGTPQKEPYIAKARSTFGGSTLPDCTRLTIPKGNYFLMGDNRKGSSDSRHDIGLVADRDIKYVMPWKSQIGRVDKQWHDAGNDLADTSKITLDTRKFMDLVNGQRKTKNAVLLTWQPKLQQSAARRGEVILKTNDFSYEASKSGYTMPKAMADVGYSNIVWGEWTFQGYYDADELADAIFEFSQNKKFALDTDFQELGVAEVDGTVNGCPSHVIVQHYAGYVPPNYKESDIQSWEKVLDNLAAVAPSWAKLKEYPDYYASHKTDVDRINELIATRRENIAGIVARMRKNQWLTGQQTEYVKTDERLYAEQEALARKLNSN